MAKEQEQETKAQADLRRVTANAKRLKLKGRELTAYIDDHMKGFGYRTRVEYVDPDDDDSGNSSGGRFGFGRRNNDNDDDDEL